MSAQCVLLDRARHMPPPARESYIHRISREIAPTLLPRHFFSVSSGLPAITTSTTHICDRVMDLGNRLGQEPTQHPSIRGNTDAPTLRLPTDRC